MKLTSLINEKKPSESRLLALSLTFSSGFIDTYTYIQRGHTLSAGQTGNIVFFATSLANHNLRGMINRATTFIAFTAGLVLVGALHKYIKSNYWRIFCLFPIILICAVIGFIPSTVPNYYIVPAIAFGLAMQNASFSKIEGMGYNNAFTTGNLKKSAVAWSAYFFGADKSQHTAAVNYMWLVIAFAVGAIISAIVQKYLVLRTIWIGGILLLVINIVYMISLRKRKNINI
ncbi:YoaK family protein [uncultured Lactobacillus sp.]|uniref:YoaK family protein n=1 Tax=uncultured Lactobacillus sp. TaxID=153152 RepID=UPI002602F3DC|nr:YoaK family protein [uncultured Lactobacillus sp.]